MIALAASSLSLCVVKAARVLLAKGGNDMVSCQAKVSVSIRHSDLEQGQGHAAKREQDSLAP